MRGSSEGRFLELLGLKAEKPSLGFLNRIVDAHLRTVPWENVSKLLRKREGSQTLPSFSEYVYALADNQFGGTCHAQNTHLTSLLRHLGFDATLVSAVPEGPPSHVAIRIKLGAQSYCIDVGLMSSFAGVFPLDQEQAIEKKLGDQRFVLKPLPDGENWTLQIYRDDKVVRSYKSSSVPIDFRAHMDAVQDSLSDSAYFMKVLAVHRHLGDQDVGIWNNKLYSIRGTQREVRILDSVDELAKAFSNSLFLPKYPLNKVVEILAIAGVDIFSETD